MALVSLSKEELLYLDDGLTLLTEADEDGFKYRIGRHLAPIAISAAPLSLLLKIGSALVYLDDEQLSEKEMDFHEDELWCLREVSQSHVIYFEKPVGLNIKIKVYRALLNLYTENLLSDEDITTTDITEGSPKDLEQILDIFHSLEEN